MMTVSQFATACARVVDKGKQPIVVLNFLQGQGCNSTSSPEYEIDTWELLDNNDLVELTLCEDSPFARYITATSSRETPVKIIVSTKDIVAVCYETEENKSESVTRD